MKSQKGVTLTALVIYLAVAAIVISSMAMLTSHFYSNVDAIKNQSDYVVEYNKFNMFFIQDIKTNKTAQVSEHEITFENGVKYEYRVNSIYRIENFNEEEIATKIKSAKFTSNTYTINKTTKNLISVQLEIGTNEKLYQKQIEYVLKYW